MPHESDEVEVVLAASATQLDAVRSLCREYGDSIAQHEGGPDVLVAQAFDAEVAALPGDYAPPGGALLLALVNGAPGGCAALRPLSTGVVELKRLYVRHEFRGQSLGRRLLIDAIDRAVATGASRMRLDTLPFMRSAVRLYRSMGFEEIQAYVDRPTPGARFFELRLDPAPPETRLVHYDPEYAPDFERLNRAWLEEYFRVEEKDMQYFADPTSTIVTPGGEIFFIQEGNRRVGTCAVIRDQTGDFELGKMAVQADCRGKGYGQWLVSTAIDFARERGARRMYLLSDEKLPDALRLYERMGFERRPFPGNTGYERGDVYMELAITA